MSDYMEEVFSSAFHGSVEALTRDALGREANTLVAVDDEEVVGFALWRRTWDAHHGLRGAERLDLYVEKDRRGGSLAPELLLAVAEAGGVFLKGQGVTAQGDRLYERLAVVFPGTDFSVGGRASTASPCARCCAHCRPRAPPSSREVRLIKCPAHLEAGRDRQAGARVTTTYAKYVGVVGDGEPLCRLRRVGHEWRGLTLL